MDTLEINISESRRDVVRKKRAVKKRKSKRERKKPRKMCECERNDQRVSERDSGM